MRGDHKKLIAHYRRSKQKGGKPSSHLDKNGFKALRNGSCPVIYCMVLNSAEFKTKAVINNEIFDVLIKATPRRKPFMDVCA